MKCPRCKGQGFLAEDIQESVKCHICFGEGKITKEVAIKRIEVEIEYGSGGKEHTSEMKYYLKGLVNGLRDESGREEVILN